MKRSLKRIFTNEAKWIKFRERNKFCIRKYTLWTSNPVKLFNSTTIWIMSCTRQLKAIDLIWSVNDVRYNALNTKQIPAIFSNRMNTVLSSNYIIRKDGIQLFPYCINLIPIHSSNIWRNKSHFVRLCNSDCGTRMCCAKYLKVSRLFPAKVQWDVKLPGNHSSTYGPRSSNCSRVV